MRQESRASERIWNRKQDDPARPPSEHVWGDLEGRRGRESSSFSLLKPANSSQPEGVRRCPVWVQQAAGDWGDEAWERAAPDIRWEHPGRWGEGCHFTSCHHIDLNNLHAWHLITFDPRYDAGTEASPGPVSDNLMALENISDNSAPAHHTSVRLYPRWTYWTLGHLLISNIDRKHFHDSQEDYQHPGLVHRTQF